MLYFWRLCCRLPWCPGRVLFYCLCWQCDKHLPPPAATMASPETTAGGGAASSAPHPLTLYPFRHQTCPEPCLADPTQQGACSPAEQEGWQLTWPSSLRSQLGKRRKGTHPCCPVSLWWSLDPCLPGRTARQGWPMGPSHALPTSHGSLQVPAAGPRLMREASLAVGDLGVVEYMEGYGRG